MVHLVVVLGIMGLILAEKLFMGHKDMMEQDTLIVIMGSLKDTQAEVVAVLEGRGCAVFMHS